jgi:hypothetical protein
MINEDFGLEVQGKDKQTLLRELNDFLIESLSQGMLPIIIIDEAQNLSPDTLEEVRLLSNLESDSAKLVQVVLVGQPELRDIIVNPALRQLRQRIVVKCHLEPLGRDELQNYIYHRLQVAGHQGGLTFQPEVFEIIYEFSSGIPRLVNLICDYLLLAAFSDEVYVLTGEMCQEVARELSWQEPAETAAQSESVADKTSDKSKVLVNELFRRLSFIQEQVVDLQSLHQRLGRIENALQSLDVLSRQIEQQRVRLANFEGVLGQVEKALLELLEPPSKTGEVVELKSVNKAKKGYLQKQYTDEDMP